jgi:hypothetical protein
MFLQNWYPRETSRLFNGLISPYSTLVESFVKGVLDEAEFEVKPNMDQGDLIQV